MWVLFRRLFFGTLFRRLLFGVAVSGFELNVIRLIIDALLVRAELVTEALHDHVLGLDAKSRVLVRCK